MPHLSIEHSSSLAGLRMDRLCRKLADALEATGLFPLAGIRVRTFAAAHGAIADDDARNSFVDMVLRIGAGRSMAEKTATGKALMAVAEGEFAAELAGPYFALSLEIVEIDAELSWKTNTIHQRLKARQ